MTHERAFCRKIAPRIAPRDQAVLPPWWGKMGAPLSGLLTAPAPREGQGLPQRPRRPAGARSARQRRQPSLRLPFVSGDNHAGGPVQRRLMAAVVAGVVLALSPAAALGIGYNLDHDHDVENVVAVRAHEPGTFVTGWQWQIRDGKRRANVGAPADQLARLLAINPNGGRFSDLLVRGHAGNSRGDAPRAPRVAAVMTEDLDRGEGAGRDAIRALTMVFTTPIITRKPRKKCRIPLEKTEVRRFPDSRHSSPRARFVPSRATWGERASTCHFAQ
jgi:hypothetical protein